MKKKSKGEKVFQGKEAFQRMNFLFQAAHVVLEQSSKPCDLPAYYGKSMLAVAQKSVLKIEPIVKRDLCKGCGNLLKPGVSSRNRVRSGKIISTCLRCGTIKRFPLKTGYHLWVERREACLEVMEVPSSCEEFLNVFNRIDKQSSCVDSEDGERGVSLECVAKAQ